MEFVLVLINALVTQDTLDLIVAALIVQVWEIVQLNLDKENVLDQMNATVLTVGIFQIAPFLFARSVQKTQLVLLLNNANVLLDSFYPTVFLQLVMY